jgi:hypothetical protein
MLYIKTLVMILLAVLVSPFYMVFGTPIDSKLAPRLPYPVDITQYTVTINGREHQLNGTIQVLLILPSPSCWSRLLTKH